MTVISSGGKIVAFSAVKENVDGPRNAEQSETHQKPSGTPISLQVTMVTTIARPMSSEEYGVVMAFIGRSVDSIKDVYKKGKNFYDEYNIGGAIKAIGGVADIISGIKKTLPEEEDPIVTKLSELESNIKNLGEKLTDNFNEMKALISNQTFFTHIMSPTLVLTMHMRDCIKNPGDDSKKNFQRAYKAHRPLKLQYHLNSYLSQDATNPLKLGMNAERAKTKTTFDKWEDIISRVMAQFIILEAFAKGLLDPRYETNVDRLIDASKEIFTSMDSWKEEYKKDKGYWEDLKGFLDPYIMSHTNLNHFDKVFEIDKKLSTYLTSDMFFVCAFNEATWKKDYFYFCNNASDHIIGVWNKGKCNCFIYRSFTGSTASQNEYDTLLHKLDNTSMHWHGNLENTVKNELVEKRNLHGSGFIGMFMPNVGFEYCRLNREGTNHLPPGYCLTLTRDDNRGDMTALVALT